MRADVFLVEKGYAASRAEAQAAIEAGKVLANGKPVAKSSQQLSGAIQIEYAPAHPYVSRGALKLVAALDHFDLSPAGLTCLDIGASTGGFTEVLLERGAKKVFAVDVGQGQLHPKIANNPRVVSMEKVNARELAPEMLPGRIEVIVADVSFISLSLALPSALGIAASGAWLVALVKPQFEVGKEKVGKGGIVTDDAARVGALASIADTISSVYGWKVAGTIDSPIAGSDGNREYLIAARKP